MLSRIPGMPRIYSLKAQTPVVRGGTSDNTRPSEYFASSSAMMDKQPANIAKTAKSEGLYSLLKIGMPIAVAACAKLFPPERMPIEREPFSFMQLI